MFILLWAGSLSCFVLFCFVPPCCALCILLFSFCAFFVWFKLKNLYKVLKKKQLLHMCKVGDVVQGLEKAEINTE